MKQTVLAAFSAAAAMVLAGCSEDNAFQTGGVGTIVPVAELDTSVSGGMATASARSGDEITSADLSLRLVSADGSFDRTWPTLGDFDSSTEFNIGEYTMSAFYGAEDSEGFDAPFYYGETALTVVDGQSTPVSITATLANARVSVVYSDQFAAYFADYSARLHSPGGAYIDYSATETRDAYVRAGQVTLSAAVTKPNGVAATLQIASFTAEPRHRYVVTLDVEGGAGDAALVVNFDDQLDMEPVVLDLSDEFLTAPAPEIIAGGFSSGTAVEVVEGSAPEAPLLMTVNAPGGLAQVTLTTSSASLLACGWPAETDLLTDDHAEVARLGLTSRGLWQNPDRMAVVDFTGVIRNLTFVEAEPVTTFTLSVVDRLGKTCDPVVLTINTKPFDFWGVADEGGIWAKKAYVTIRSDERDAAAIAPTLTAYLSTDGGVTFVEHPCSADGAVVLLSDLAPGTDYQVKFSEKADPEVACSPVRFTTETALPVPNGDFEDLAETINVSEQIQGGRYTITALPVWKTNHQNITVSEPTGWASTNAKTYNLAATNQNSWFVTPSVFNSTLTFVRLNAYPASHSNATPGEYQFTAQSGANAMVIRNVAYDPAGGSIADDKKTTGASGYYCRNQPDIANRAVGKLFLGSYSYSDGAETYSEGVSFAARPASLSGYYTYANDSQDASETGMVTIKLLDGNTVVGSGSAALTASADYKEFTVPIVYTSLMQKATSLRIMFASSDHIGSVAQETSSVKTTNRCSVWLQESFGAVLTVDNLSFTY